MLREREQSPPELPPARRRGVAGRRGAGDVDVALDALREIVRDAKAPPAAQCGLPSCCWTAQRGPDSVSGLVAKGVDVLAL